MFRRFFDDGLAQSSYLLACERTRTAAIIDPRRDIDVYVDAAHRDGLSIVYAIETHIHADFASGSRELGAVGSVTIAGPGAALQFPHEEVGHDSTLQLGDVTLTFLHTPGHTPEHVCVVAREPDAPVRVFTGDTLFVGAVGRPDLLGEGVTRPLAEALYESLFTTLLALGDDVQVHPGHGAGSLCGAGIGTDPHSTIGRERRFNAFLQHRSREAFVSAVLADLPETPPYFPRMKRLNHEGAPVLGLSGSVPPPRSLSAASVAEAVDAGAWLLDLRDAAAYAQGHPAGAVSIAFGPKIGYWAGWVLPADARVLLMLDGGASQAAEARRQLLRVGIDAVEGYVQEGFPAWRAAGLPVRETPELPVEELAEPHRRRPAVTIVDVRSRREWEAGHLPGALHVPLAELVDRLSELPHGPIATMCEAGYRSRLAASLLERQGLPRVMHVPGGMNAWRGLRHSPAT